MAGQSIGTEAGVVEHQGRQANSNGMNLQDDIAAKLRQCGYEGVQERDRVRPQGPWYVRNYRGLLRDMYAAPWTVHFYAYHPQRHPRGLLIFACYQSRSGSVDAKFPYVIGNLTRAQLPALLLLIGGKAKKPALAWAKAQETEDLIVMTSLEEWLEYANRGRL